MLSALLSAVFLLLPPMGTDLSAAVARAGFYDQHGLTPVDLRWYGGTQQLGYSLGAQALTAVLGARVTGALAASVTSVALALLLARTRVRRPLLGALVATPFVFGNLVSGRITYAVGLALGVLAALALTGGRTRRAGLLALLASAASPVAGLFAGLAGAALLLTGRRREGVVLGLAAAAPLLLTAGLFGQGGSNTMSWRDASHAMVLSAGAALLTRHRVVRAAGALSLAGNLLAYLVQTPVGLNATRLAVMLAVPVVVATARTGLVLTTAAAVALTAYQPPVVTGDWRTRGTPAADPSYAAPLVAELDRRQPTGRVEVPPTRHYWEAAHVAAHHPLARGWLRQLDTGRHPLFFDGTLSAETYRAWLVDNGVQYVAVADVEPSWVGRAEAALVRGGLPYLREVWRGEHWLLFEVEGRPTVSDATVVDLDAVSVTVRVEVPGDHLVRVQHSRWLVVEGGDACLAPEGRWTRLSAREAGTFRVTSSLRPGAGDPCP